MSHRRAPTPLTADAYAPFGAVVSARARGAGKPANMGTAERFDFLTPLVNRRPSAAANVAVFRSRPLLDRPFLVRLLERHPHSTQMFVPMNARRYLVLVAGGGDRPDLATFAAFLARGDQGITYAPGVWHHPLVALDAETDFACVVFEDGGAGDCEVVDLPDGDRLVVDVPD